MSFGLSNASATFMKLKNGVSHPYLDSFMVVFSGEILVYSKSEMDNIKQLRNMIQRLKNEKLYAMFLKYEFWLSFMSFIGHVVTKDGIMVDPTNIEVVQVN